MKIDDTYEIDLKSTTTFNRFAIVDVEVKMKKPDDESENYQADSGKIYVNGEEISGGGYPEPTGTIELTENGTFDVKDYAEANVNVQGSSILRYIKIKGRVYETGDKITNLWMNPETGLVEQYSSGADAPYIYLWDTVKNPTLDKNVIVSILHDIYDAHPETTRYTCNTFVLPQSSILTAIDSELQKISLSDEAYINVKINVLN